MVRKDDRSKMGMLLRLRNYFTTGLLVLTPTFVTIWILVKTFRWFDNILGRWYTQLFEYLNLRRTHIPGLGAITLFVLIALIGFLARLYVGRKLFAIWEKAINNVPLINRIYLALRQLSDSFAKGGAIIFKRPVIIEYPRHGVFSIGFVTRDCGPAFCKLIGENVSSIFIPTTPNPTSGVIIFVPQKDMIALDMTVEDAMKLIISAGVVTPDIKLPDH
ncbi:MAG: DUF502 domain-containing protein [Candidatus Latescibacteria bacterium]|jgi:uncharacterized membrane protein|nr:DUF502 domain-containing protein [Candidatus Latescibacterota bacterium]